MYLDYFECSLTLKNKQTNKCKCQLGSGESDSLKLPSFFSCWSMGLVHWVGMWDVFSWISRQFFSGIWRHLSNLGAWRLICGCRVGGLHGSQPAQLPILKRENMDLIFYHHCPALRTWHFPLAILETMHIFPPSFLPCYPIPGHFFLIFLIPVGTADNFESQDYWLCLLLLRALQGLQVSTKLWAFSQFTHRFIICWHCFAINRSTFTDIIDSTASLLTNTLFNVSNLPSYFT